WKCTTCTHLPCLRRKVRPCLRYPAALRIGASALATTSSRRAWAGVLALPLGPLPFSRRQLLLSPHDSPFLLVAPCNHGLLGRTVEGAFAAANLVPPDLDTFQKAANVRILACDEHVNDGRTHCRFQQPLVFGCQIGWPLGLHFKDEAIGWCALEANECVGRWMTKLFALVFVPLRAETIQPFACKSVLALSPVHHDLIEVHCSHRLQ